jgi:tRNA threonylcarbamoyladenosine biosynthesis protein TsaB
MQNILAIESAIEAGSITVVDAGGMATYRTNSGVVSSAEELLLQVDAALVDAGLRAVDLDEVIVSNGPGSFTGIKIGIATALGLSSGLGIGCSGISCLEAICHSFPSMPEAAIALPFGKRDAVWQHFKSGKPHSEIFAQYTTDFIDFAENAELQILAHPRLSELLSGLIEPDRLITCDSNLSRYLALATISSRGRRSPEPIYARRIEAAAHA